jgi:hypothetical protein
VKVTLNETEIAYCYQIASLRRMLNRGFGVKDETVKADFMDGEVLGVLGEYAFAKSCNVFPRLIDRVKGGGEDCKFKGYNIDVKATRNQDKGLFIHKENKDIEIYALAVVNLPDVELKGWIKASEVIDEKYKNDKGQYVYKGKLNTHKLDRKLAA